MKNQSLQDQLLNMGLVSETKAKQARTEKRKTNKKKQKNKVQTVDETKQSLEEKKAMQAEKDRLLNEQRKQEAQQLDLANQVRQLIEPNRLEKAQGDEGVAYHFNDGNKVKTIYVSQDLRDKIIAGKLAIVRLAQDYEVVPNTVAEKVKARDEKAIVVMFAPEPETDENDPYADYQIPDDLIWWFCRSFMALEWIKPVAVWPAPLRNCNLGYGRK